MSKVDKLLQKMRHNLHDWHIEDLKTIAKKFKVEHRQPGGSHVTFRFPSKKILTVPAHKPIKPIYIKQFIALLDEQGASNEAS